MATPHTYTKYKDVHSITSTTSEDDLHYEVSKIECDSVTSIIIGVISPLDTIDLPIEKVDGKYRIHLWTNNEEEEINSEDTFDILFYNNLLLNIIEKVEHSICKCCHNCNDCDETNYCDLYLTTILDELAFTFLNNPRYTSYLNLIADSINCNIDAYMLCSLTNKMINGEEKQQELLLNIIGIYYLAFYISDVLEAADQEEADYIKLKYDYVKIAKCLKKIGINISDTSDIFLNTDEVTVNYFQLPQADGMDELLLIITDNYLLSKPVAPFEEFNAGKNVTYGAIGKAVFVIKEVPTANFLIYDQLNLNITDEFDIEYDVDLQAAIFVSKEIITFGTTYYNFKNIDYGI